MLSHVIYYHGQHHLFLYTSDYLESHTLEECMMAFLAQFFYSQAVGALVLSTLLTGIYLQTWFVLTRMTRREDILRLSCIPSLGLWIWTSALDHSLSLVVNGFLLATLLAFLVFLFHGKKGVRSVKFPARRVTAITALVLVVYGFVCAYCLLHTFSIAEYRMIKAQQAADKQDWDEVLHQTSRYLDYQKRPNPLISYFRNIALFKKGELFNHLLEYPMSVGVNGLYFPWQGRTRETEFGHYLLEELGAINHAQHWEFEAMVVWGETAPRLINLARYAIANGRIEVARHYIKRLRQALFYQDEANQLEAYANIGRVPGLQPFRVDAPDKANFINVLNIGPNLEYILECVPDNQMAYEYLICDLLLSGNMQKFLEILSKWQKPYTQLPALLQEAVIVCQIGGMDMRKFEIAPDTQQRFERYAQLFQQGDMHSLRREFGRSYWFYLNYISPYGSKIKK